MYQTTPHSNFVLNDEVGQIVSFVAPIIKKRITCIYQNTPMAEDGRAAPQGVTEWLEMLALSGIRPIPMTGDQSFHALLVQDKRVGWLCLFDCRATPERQCQHFCHEFCEFLLAGCPKLGKTGQECYPLPCARIRDIIANRVAGELC